MLLCVLLRILISYHELKIRGLYEAGRKREVASYDNNNAGIEMNSSYLGFTSWRENISLHCTILLTSKSDCLGVGHLSNTS